MQMKAFRLNEYENCGKVLKYSDPFELYTVNVQPYGKRKLHDNDGLGFKFLV